MAAQPGSQLTALRAARAPAGFAGGAAAARVRPQSRPRTTCGLFRRDDGGSRGLHADPRSVVNAVLQAFKQKDEAALEDLVSFRGTARGAEGEAWTEVWRPLPESLVAHQSTRAGLCSEEQPVARPPRRSPAPTWPHRSPAPRVPCAALPRPGPLGKLAWALDLPARRVLPGHASCEVLSFLEAEPGRRFVARVAARGGSGEEAVFELILRRLSAVDKAVAGHWRIHTVRLDGEIGAASPEGVVARFLAALQHNDLMAAFAVTQSGAQLTHRAPHLPPK